MTPSHDENPRQHRDIFRTQSLPSFRVSHETEPFLLGDRARYEHLGPSPYAGPRGALSRDEAPDFVTPVKKEDIEDKPSISQDDVHDKKKPFQRARKKALVACNFCKRMCKDAPDVHNTNRRV